MKYSTILFCVWLPLAIGCRRNTVEKPPKSIPRVSDDPATLPAAEEAQKGAISESDLIRFIAASNAVVRQARLEAVAVEASVEGFAQLTRLLSQDRSLAGTLHESNLTQTQWARIGGVAWKAWSIAQVDYNTEAPLRELSAKLDQAQAKLAKVQETLRSGSRRLTESERVELIERAREEQASALRRAEDWARRAVDLERQIALLSPSNAPENHVEPELRPPADGPLDPFAPPADRAFPSPRPLAEAADLVEERRHELEVVRQHEADERQSADRAAGRSVDPLALSPREKAQVIAQSQQQAADIAHQIDQDERDRRRLLERLNDARRADASERDKIAAESDIALIRKHLEAFNAAWGMTVEGQPLAINASPE